MRLKRTGAFFLAATMLLNPAVHASPWAEKPGSYGNKTARKLLFGFQHSLFSWVMPWLEANDDRYSEQWIGFCVGIGKTVVYTGAGLIQLATFPVPVDFPDIDGIRIPGKEEKRPKGMTKLAVAPPEKEEAEAYDGAFGEGRDEGGPVEEASQVESAAPAAPEPASEEIPSLDELWQTPPQEAPSAVENEDAAMEAALEEAAEWAQDDGSPYVK